SRASLLSLSLLALAACGSGGGGGGGPPPQAPTGLSYATPLLFRVGVAATPASPTVSGGAPTLYDVQPALPAGLSIDPATGVISGTPTASATTTPYVVT